MACRAVDALEGDFQHEAKILFGAHGTHRPEALDRVVAHELVEDFELRIGEAEIGFSDRHELVALGRLCPDAEGEVGIIARPLAMAALRVKHDRIDIVGIALPLEPWAFEPAGLIGAVLLLDHHTFDDRIGRRLAQRVEFVPAREGDEVGEIETVMRRMFDDLCETLAAFEEGFGADVVVTLEEQIIGAHEGRIVFRHLGRHRFPIQPLLQVGEGAGRVVGALCAADQQLAIDDAVEIDRLDHIRESAANIVAGAGIELFRATETRHLHANSVPFPFRGVIGRIELFEITIFDRVGEHDRMEDGGCGENRLVRPALQPGEEFHIGRGEAVPEGLDLGHVFSGHIRQGLLGEPCRDADPECAGDEFQEGETGGRVEMIKQVAHSGAHLGAAECIHAADDL